MFGQLGKAHGVGVDILLVNQSVPDQHVHHCQHERSVRSRQRLDEDVCPFGCDGADRIDDHEGCTARPRFLDERPQMAVGEQCVGSPQQDQV